MSGIYDHDDFFARYMQMDRSKGLHFAGEWKQLEKLLPDLEDACILDLGCGIGWHASYFAKNGASSITAIDQSEKMIEQARKLHSHPKITYVQADLCAIQEDKPFDLVFANLCLHYINDLLPLFEHIYKLLKQDGIFLFNIEHPIFTAGDQTWINEPPVWKVDNYFSEGKRETVFLDTKVEKYHHALTTILNGLLKTGFTLEAVEEVVPSLELLDKEVYKLEMKCPMMLLVRARKAEKRA